MNGYGTKMLRRRPPFWLPALNYYTLMLAVCATAFILIWGMLHDDGEELPWVTAAVTSVVLLAGAVFLREFVLRRARDRFLADQRMLDRSLKGVISHNAKKNGSAKKLTLEKNSALLREIAQKSEAAKILGKVSDGHKEVYEMCGRYLSINSQELAKVNPGSPRLAALLKGKDAAEEFHKFHLLQWAEIESRNLTNDSKNRVKVSDKLESAQRALNVIDSALEHYPNESNLIESGEALNEFIASIKLTDWLERAERAAFKKNYRQAKRVYQDALFFLQHNDGPLEGREALIERVSGEIERIEHESAETES
jgi:hypothetical protein